MPEEPQWTWPRSALRPPNCGSGGRSFSGHDCRPGVGIPPGGDVPWLRPSRPTHTPPLHFQTGRPPLARRESLPRGPCLRVLLRSPWLAVVTSLLSDSQRPPLPMPDVLHALPRPWVRRFLPRLQGGRATGSRTRDCGRSVGHLERLQKLHQCGTALLAMQKQFSRAHGCKHLPLLVNVLEAKMTNSETTTTEAVA